MTQVQQLYYKDSVSQEVAPIEFYPVVEAKDVLPEQSSKAGAALFTTGSSVEWRQIQFPTVDTSLSSVSSNAIANFAVTSAIDNANENILTNAANITSLAASVGNIAKNYLPLAGGVVTGTTVFSKKSSVEPVGPALIVGGTKTEQHIEIATNAVTAVGDNSAAATLYLNKDQGKVQVGSNVVVENNGEITAVAYNLTSDRTLKENISDVDADLQSLSAKQFNFKGDERTHIGLIAQDVQTVLPEAVTVNEEGKLSIEYSALVAILINKVNQLENRIKKLEGC